MQPKGWMKAKGDSRYSGKGTPMPAKTGKKGPNARGSTMKVGDTGAMSPSASHVAATSRGSMPSKRG